MSNKMRITGVVKINEERGYGNDMFSVVGQTTLERNKGEYVLIPHGDTDRSRAFNIFKSHCHTDMACMRAYADVKKAQQEESKRIGR